VAPIRYDVLAATIARRAPACGVTKVIGVDGPSGAGKTEVALTLGARLRAPVLHLEDIYPGWSGLAETPGMVVNRVLEPLAVGEIGLVARWDWEHNRPGTVMRFAPTPLLILEGVGSGARICRPFLSLLVWLDAAASVRKARALSRDGDVYAPFWDMWAEQERRLFAADDIRASAEVVVDTGRSGILDPTKEDRGAGNG
jgi:cytidylate kinase